MMRFLCRIGWHDWVFCGKVEARCVNYILGTDRRVMAQQAECKSCKKLKLVGIGND